MTLANSRRARPVGDAGGRSIGWWGAAFGVLTLAHLVAGLLVAAIYLRAFTTVWPPAPGVSPGIVGPTVAAGLALLSALLLHLTYRRTQQGGVATPLVPAAAGVAALIAAGVRGAGTIFSSWPITDHAYWSIRWAIGAMDVVLLTALGGVAVFATVQTARRRFVPGAHAELAVVTLWAWATFALVAASYVVFGAVTGWSG
jgi:hypothetical protein